MRTSGDDIPERAVVAGESSAGGPLYVGRSEHEGGLFPGKVNPSHSCCYIAWGGAEHSKENYDVSLCIISSWDSTRYSQINPDHGVCYIPYGGEEIAKEHYQVHMVRHFTPFLVT